MRARVWRVIQPISPGSTYLGMARLGTAAGHLLGIIL